MSVLLINPADELGSALVQRLIAENDEVRVISDHPEAAHKWTRLGAHVARGDAEDPDLIERAAQNVRTIVVLQEATDDLNDLVAAVAHGGRLASAEMRLVVCLEKGEPAVEDIVRKSGLDYVLLRTGKSSARFMPTIGHRGPRVGALVEAIDAADDIAGNPKLDLDLTTAEAWRSLGVEPPQL
jgi:hypothetical protein